MFSCSALFQWCYCAGVAASDDELLLLCYCETRQIPGFDSSVFRTNYSTLHRCLCEYSRTNTDTECTTN